MIVKDIGYSSEYVLRIYLDYLIRNLIRLGISYCQVENSEIHFDNYVYRFIYKECEIDYMNLFPNPELYDKEVNLNNIEFSYKQDKFVKNNKIDNIQDGIKVKKIIKNRSYYPSIRYYKKIKKR